MLKTVKRASLRVLKESGVFRVVGDSDWRRRRLLILCYHGTAIEDEDHWRPGLFMPLPQLQQRLELLQREGYNVLPLGEALVRLRRRDLPRASVALTFDDGTYDFYKNVYPLLKKYGFPATVYQTTYYSDRQLPVFNLTCSYLLWKRRGEVLDIGTQLGLKPPLDLRTAESRHAIVRQLLARTEGMTGTEKNEVAKNLAALLQVDFSNLVGKRILHIMNAAEIKQLASEGVDFQLHTHRHRTPQDPILFAREIRENRERVRELTGRKPDHFCYPSGVYSSEFLPWLREQEVVSATTCDISLATVTHDPLLLPRFVDTQGQSLLEYEAWLSGVGHLLSAKRRAKLRLVPVGD